MTKPLHSTMTQDPGAPHAHPVHRNDALRRSIARSRNPGLIAHAGLARNHIGGTPTEETLSRALAIGVDAIELDICVSEDRVPVVRHDTTLPRRAEIADLSLAELRRELPGLLSLHEALEIIDAAVPVLLDVKTIAAADLLGHALNGAGDVDNVAVCTQSTAALLVMHRRAPRIARWLALPDVGGTVRQGARRITATMVTRRSRALATHTVASLGRAALAAHRGPMKSMPHIAGIPWRTWLAEDIIQMAKAVDANGVCLHRWIINPDVVKACHDGGLPVVAYTINRADDARRVVAAGVDLITTDRPEIIRDAIGFTQPGLARQTG